MERLQKILAQRGVGSRRQCEQLIADGRVRVAGQVATLGQSVAGDAVIEVDGRAVPTRPASVYLALHKPAGCVTTVRDPQGRPTVMQYVADVPERVYPVGRLDYDSEGLLIMTNDGALAHHLMHPSHELVKEYLVDVAPALPEEALVRLRTGVTLEDGPTAPAGVQVVRRQADSVRLRMRIHEGRNRQIRRMVAAVGGKVRRLVRTAVGPVRLGTLPPGAVRPLTEAEVRGLHKR